VYRKTQRTPRKILVLGQFLEEEIGDPAPWDRALIERGLLPPSSEPRASAAEPATVCASKVRAWGSPVSRSIDGSNAMPGAPSATDSGRRT
ncbi:hypothetical protein ACV34I_30015, partial [Pseudomonas aeruginosa]